MFINQLLNVVFQVVVFSIIPLIWWFFTARKKENFFVWIGLKKPVAESKSKFVIYMVATFIVVEILGQIGLFFRGDLEAADSAYKGMGASAIPTIFLYAFGQTALSEEILFRGFLLKRLNKQFGFTIGTTITAVIFGLVHIIIVWGQASPLALCLIVAYPLVVTYAFAWLNEKKMGGSIIPSFILHGLINFIEITGQALM